MKQQTFLMVIVAGITLILGVLVVFPNTPRSVILDIYGQPLSEELLTIENSLPTQTGKNLFLVQSKNLTQKVNPELVDLDSQIISCDANIDNLLSTGSIGGSCVGGGTILSNVKGKFLGGQCCGAMKDTKKYHEQLQKLQSYKNIPDIPLNPYKTPIELAKKWIDYDKETTLTSDQQMIMDKAMKLSKEGPCCCKCWHYYVNEGIAKKMIQEKGWTARQVATFWDTSSIC